MQSVTQKMEPGYAGSSEVQMPARPEPIVSERLSALRDDFTGGWKTRPAGAGARLELAEAFRKLARGMHPGAAFDRARDFFRSSGHAWTRGLSR